MALKISDIYTCACSAGDHGPGYRPPSAGAEADRDRAGTGRTRLLDGSCRHLHRLLAAFYQSGSLKRAQQHTHTRL